MEFEFRTDGLLRYANNSNYKSDVMIRKQGVWHRWAGWWRRLRRRVGGVDGSEGQDGATSAEGILLVSTHVVVADGAACIVCMSASHVHFAVKVNTCVLDELKRIIEDSEIMK